MINKKKFLAVELPLIVWIAAMLTVSSLPQSSLPEVDIINIDKLAHCVEYAVLAVLFFRFLHRRVRRPVYLAAFTVAFCLVFGALDEVHQLFIPGRSCSVLDWAADAAGAVIAVVVSSFTHLLKPASA